MRVRQRIAYFLGRKDRAALSTQTDPAKINAGRESAVRTVAAWKDRAGTA